LLYGKYGPWLRAGGVIPGADDRIPLPSAGKVDTARPASRDEFQAR